MNDMKKHIGFSLLASIMLLTGCSESVNPVQEKTPLPPSETVYLENFAGLTATPEQWAKEYDADSEIPKEEPYTNSYNNGQIEVSWEMAKTEDEKEELRANYIKYDFEGREVPREMALQEVTKFIPGKELESSLENKAENMVDPSNKTIGDYYRIVNDQGEIFLGIVAFDYDLYEKEGTLKVTHVYLQ